MAIRGKPLTAALVQQAVRMARERGVRAAARELNVDRNTVRKYLRGQSGRPREEVAS
jgi:hypothetical protein